MDLVVWLVIGLMLVAPVLLWSVGRGLLGTPLSVRNQTRVLVVAAVMLGAIVLLFPRLSIPSDDVGTPYGTYGWVLTAMYAVALILTLASLSSSRPRPLKDGDRWALPTIGWVLSALATALFWLQVPLI